MPMFRVRLPKVVEFIETEVHEIEADSAEAAMDIVKNTSGDLYVQYESSDYETKEIWYHDMTATEVKV